MNNQNDFILNTGFDLLQNALNIFVQLEGTNIKNKYEIVCSPDVTNGESLIQLVFGLYHLYVMITEGAEISAEDLRIVRYPEFQEYILENFGIDFKIKVASFRTDYRKLYIYPDLHVFASRGIIRHRHIRQWERISPLLPFVPIPTTVEDFDNLLP